jgi:hypothetical protein
MKNKIIAISLIVSLALIVPSHTFASADCTGGIIDYSRGNTIHTFTSNGTFNCTDAGEKMVKVLVIGGGGGGSAGGGGAGGYQYDSARTINAQSYSVTVGSGGSGHDNSIIGDNGNNSVFDNIVAYGGGGGGKNTGVPSTSQGADGSSGGGGSYSGGGLVLGGIGSQGNNGGTNGDTSSPFLAGGGGGIGEAGGDASGDNAGNGGSGVANSITGSSIFYAGGGGGGAYTSGTPGNGGLGGGGNGGSDTEAGSNGVANTGGGGGGAGGVGSPSGGNGGSGVVVISYPSPPSITGSGTINKLAKFASTTEVTNSLLSDDGSNLTLTSGNLFMQISSMIDTVTNGALNFGTSLATTMIFGRSGQNMIINSKVGIGTSTPTATLQVNGSLSTGSINTNSKCNSTASPAVCGSAPAGSIALPNGTNTLIVNTSAVTANSQIFIIEDSSLGSRLGITCNTALTRNYTISARTPGTSFTIKSNNNPAANKACLSYFIVN